MTAIAGIAAGGRVHMGADSLGVSYYLGAHQRAEPKLFHAGPFLVGLSGCPRISQVIQYELDLDDDPRCEDARRFMCTEFVNRLRKTLKNAGALKQSDTVERIGHRSYMLVGFRRRLFKIFDNFQVDERADGYDAVGCAEDYILGNLHATAEMSVEPAERIRRALECAEWFSAGVRGPFVIESQEKASG